MCTSTSYLTTALTVVAAQLPAASPSEYLRAVCIQTKVKINALQ